MSFNNFDIQGLNESEVLEARVAYGSNKLKYRKEYPFLKRLRELASDPMIILLLLAAVIYFVTGSAPDGLFMLSAIVLVSLIDIYQDARSRNALEKLKAYSQPYSKVLRSGKVIPVNSEDLVIGDYLLVEEGSLVAADATIVHSNDFSIDESVLTGESFAVQKDKTSKDPFLYSGTTALTGLAIATITAIGNNTRLGKIGKSLQDIKQEKTPLEKQIKGFVTSMVFAGALVFLAVWAINYFNTYLILDSLLKALTLAMSILPEEIPVAVTTFLAMGAWRLMKSGIIVKQMKTVETLGSATVICTDKTGTITQNKMSLAKLFVPAVNKITNADEVLAEPEKDLITTAMWASEPIPFDPMETALHQAYSAFASFDLRPAYKMIHEYPLGGKPPMMTHVFENHSGDRIIAAKGAPEALLDIVTLAAAEKKQIFNAIRELTTAGYRVLAVASANFAGNDFPPLQQQFNFHFKGIISFYDPPKKNIGAVLDAFYTAGIAVKIITGDNAATTAAIAKQIGFRNAERTISGDEIMKLTDDELIPVVASHSIFTRMFPEAKLRIINALKASNQIVAMTGDGVNDGPALKAANIGIAMGRKGSEIAKQSASLILQDDDLAKMVEAIAMGRKIYANLKKAIRYIISIHIPIILTVFIPLAAGWIYPNIFSPVHIIFMELIMGPTCSIIYENEPLEKNTMIHHPRTVASALFSFRELFTSILQGLMITVGTLLCYLYATSQGYDEALTRTMVFIALISANIFLTLVNRSFYFSVFTTLAYKNRLVPVIICLTVLLTLTLLYINPFTGFFKFRQPGVAELFVSIGTGWLSVVWYEIVKWRKRMKKQAATTSLIRLNSHQAIDNPFPGIRN